MMWRTFSLPISSNTLVSCARTRTKLRRPESWLTSPVNIPRFEDAKGIFLIVRDTDDFDAASQHDKDAVASVSAVENHFIFWHPPLCAEWRKACNLRIIQFREHRVDLVGGLGHTSR